MPVSETTSVSTPIGLAISGRALDIAPKGAPVVPELDLGRVGGRVNRDAGVAGPQGSQCDEGEGGSAPHLFPNIILRSETRNRRRGQ
jgi:hypothetical protein